LTHADFVMPGNVVEMGEPPVQVDLMTGLTGLSWEDVATGKVMTGLTGLSWEDAATGKVRTEYGQTPVYIIGRESLVANKRALGRQRDLADLEAIGEL